MRTVIMKSDGYPDNSCFYDKETGEQIHKIQSAEFADLHACVTKKWTGILNIYVEEEDGRLVLDKNDEMVTKPEQVYIEIGVTE